MGCYSQFTSFGSPYTNDHQGLFWKVKAVYDLYIAKGHIWVSHLKMPRKTVFKAIF